MELLERYHFFPCSVEWGCFVSLKFYVFRTMGFLNLVILFFLKNILSKVTMKMCNFDLQIRF